MLKEFQSILEKYGFAFQFEERGRIVHRYYLDKTKGHYHECQVWPHNTWEITHYRLRRVYYSGFKTPAELENFLSITFPELSPK